MRCRLLLLLLLAWGWPAAVHAQAEPAPPGSVPVPPGPLVTPRPWPRVRVGADVRFSGLFPPTPQVAPDPGWGFGLWLSASLLPIGPMRFGLLIDFQQDRYAREFLERSERPSQSLVHSTFAFLAQLDLRHRWVRPFVAAGAGGSVVNHQSPLPSPDPASMLPTTDERDFIPLFRFRAGLGFSPVRAFEFGLLGDVSVTISGKTGGVIVKDGMLVLGDQALYAPGWGSLSLYASVNFY